MPWEILSLPLALPAFALVLFRISGLVLTAPVLASSIVPLRVRVALAMTLSAMIFPLVYSQAPAEITIVQALVGGVGELLIGATMGLAVSLLMVGAELSGLMIAQQVGIALGQVFDPTRNQQTTIVGQVFTIVLTMIFLALGGHRAMVLALLDTFEVIPLLSFRFGESMVVLLAEMMTAAFVLAIRLAGPALIALFLTTIVMGFLGRTIPQLNILSIGFQVRMFAGLGVAGLAIGVSQDPIVNALLDGMETIRSAFGL